MIRLAIGNAQTTEADIRRSWEVLRSCVRAVIFDLWETLIDWDREAATALGDEVDALVGGDFGERWSRSTTRYNAPIRVALAEAGVPDELHDEICALRLRHHRRSLVPRPGAVETLRRLREDGYLVGLITVCSEDIEVLWPEFGVRRPFSTPRSSLLDVGVGGVFSKPELGPRRHLSSSTAASRSASSRARRCSSATARTTSSRARAASAWTRS